MSETEQVTPLPRVESIADPFPDPTELSDADLERVVGGLARAWVEPTRVDPDMVARDRSHDAPCQT
jgi:hypothetical protein